MAFDAQNNVTDLTPHLERVKRQDDAAVSHRLRLIERSRCAGLGSYGEPLAPRSPRDLVAAAEASCQRDKAFWVSPRGLLLTALLCIRRHDDLMGETMLGAYRRGLADERRAPSWDEARLILTTLSGIRALDAVLHPLAADAMRALADIITDQPGEAA